jgi:hypothetical protein
MDDCQQHELLEFAERFSAHKVYPRSKTIQR